MLDQALHAALLKVKYRWPRLPLDSAGQDCRSGGNSECQNVGSYAIGHLSEKSLDDLTQGESGLTHSGEAIADKAKADRLAALEAEAIDRIARGRGANIGLGRVFNKLQDTVGHGNWERYFVEKFVPLGISLRTAQRYMKMATELDAVSKNDNLSLFPSATDPQAQAISDAAANARVAVATVKGQSPETSKSKSKTRVRRDGSYKLSLNMTGREMVMTDELRGSQSWPEAETEIIALLKQLHIKYVTYSEVVDGAHTGEAFEEKSDDQDSLAEA